MGLDIKKYSYSYFSLMYLRNAVLRAEGLGEYLATGHWGAEPHCENPQCYWCNSDDGKIRQTNYPALMYHSDCNGGYYSSKNKKFKKLKPYSKEWFLWGHSLEKLKKEVEELDKIIHPFLWQRDKEPWRDFCADVRSSKTQLIFR